MESKHTYKAYYAISKGGRSQNILGTKKVLKLFQEIKDKKLTESNILITRSDGEQKIFNIKEGWQFRSINGVPSITTKTTIADLFNNK